MSNAAKRMSEHWIKVKAKAEWLGVDKMIVYRHWSNIKDLPECESEKIVILEKLKAKEQLKLFEPKKEQIDTAAKIRITAWYIDKIGSVEECIELVKKIGGVYTKIEEKNNDTH
jgi:hypothetical protein